MARLESRLLMRYAVTGGTIVKAAPTRRPQLDISIQRLRDMASNPLQANAISWEQGYIARQGKAKVVFLSAEATANRVGNTASLLLEVDESQDVDKDIYARDFRPMCATTGAPTVLCGTVWSLDTLLEEKRERARDMQRRLGRRLLWEVPWQVVAQQRSDAGDESYRQHVESEQEILGKDHPIFLTQYELVPVESLSTFCSKQDLESMRGHHPRQYSAMGDTGAVYVAGVDLCGAMEQDLKATLTNPDANLKRDSTVVTVAQLKHKLAPNGKKLPILSIVDHLYLPGLFPQDAVDRIHEYVFERWRCMQCVVDASGVGDAVAEMLRARRPDQVTALKSTAYEASRMGYGLLGAIKSGRLRCYRDDGSVEAKQFWFQFGHCRRELRSNGQMRFSAPVSRQPLPGTGVKTDVHDDFVKSAAYCVEAAERHLISHVDVKFWNSPDPMEWEDGAGYG